MKRLIYINSTAYLSQDNGRLSIQQKESESKTYIAVEDIGLLILDSFSCTITLSIIQTLLEYDIAILVCNSQHLPLGLMVNPNSHTLYSKKMQSQIASSIPLKKQMWKQTIEQKIENQAKILFQISLEQSKLVETIGRKVLSGDSDNQEAQAAVKYWECILQNFPAERRDRFGAPPNNLLNYTYAILRALIARALACSGCLLVLGIHHKNQYNHFCLADDIMEPYRPIIDNYILFLIEEEWNEVPEELDKQVKFDLMQISTLDVSMKGQTRTLQSAIDLTAQSVMRSFEEGKCLLEYPKPITYV